MSNLGLMGMCTRIIADRGLDTRLEKQAIIDACHECIACFSGLARSELLSGKAVVLVDVPFGVMAFDRRVLRQTGIRTPMFLLASAFADSCIASQEFTEKDFNEVSCASGEALIDCGDLADMASAAQLDSGSKAKPG